MKKYDIWIMKLDGCVADTLAGDNLPTSGSFHTAQKRLATVIPRLNDKYEAVVVDAGAYKQGDRITVNRTDEILHLVECDA